MSSCYIIIWYLMFFYFMSSADLISIVFYSLFQIDLIWFDSILFSSIEFDFLYIVQYSISYQWMICVCLTAYVFICMNKFFCSFILSLLLIWYPFHFILSYSTLFQIDLIWFDSILFYWIWFTVLFSIVPHINKWFVSVCPSVRPSVCLSVCLFVYLYE